MKSDLVKKLLRALVTALGIVTFGVKATDEAEIGRASCRERV